MSYLIIPHLQVQGANAYATSWLINTIPLFASTMFAHALAARCAAEDQAPRVALIHHDAQLLGEHDDDDVFLPQQRIGAVGFNSRDYAAGSVMSQSSQPYAAYHGTFSLILAFDGAAPSAEAVRRFLHRAKFAGGEIVSHGGPLIGEDLTALASAEGAPGAPAYWIVDRSDLMYGQSDPIQGLFAGLERGAIAVRQAHEGALPSDEALPGSWLAPAVRGYALISPATVRHGVRHLHTGEVPRHAFAEPAVGLVQYVSLRQWGARPLPFWSWAWARDDLFVLTQAGQGPAWPLEAAPEPVALPDTATTETEEE